MVSLVISMLVAAGCKRREENFAGYVHVARDPGMMVVERAPGTLVALSPEDGSELWRYEAPFPQPDYLDLSARYRLVCPMVETPNGQLLLRYDHELHSISLRDGKRRWKIDAYLFAAGKRRCVATTPDSGVVLIRRYGVAVQKLDSEAHKVWWYQLVGLGAAVNPPEVISPAGDTLVQTDSHVISISPTGALNWAQPAQKR
jgi:outer membrane protein assembly factor BamB